MNAQLIRNLGVALLAVVSAGAQGSPKLNVQIPFGFHVGSSMLPSGAYTVYTDPSPGLVRLRSADSKSSVMIIANTVESPNRSGKGRLVFHKYGDEYFLSKIWDSGATTGHELRKSRRELEVAATAHRGLQFVLASK